jgi:hypothetical protein
LHSLSVCDSSVSAHFSAQIPKLNNRKAVFPIIFIEQALFSRAKLGAQAALAVLRGSGTIPNCHLYCVLSLFISTPQSLISIGFRVGLKKLLAPFSPLPGLRNINYATFLGEALAASCKNGVYQ